MLMMSPASLSVEFDSVFCAVSLRIAALIRSEISRMLSVPSKQSLIVVPASSVRRLWCTTKLTQIFGRV